jgi:hypothetical protein
VVLIMITVNISLSNIRCTVFIVCLCAASLGFAQAPNFALYEKIGQTADTVTFGLVWSAYLPGANLEPFNPGQVYVSPDGCEQGYDCQMQLCAGICPQQFSDNKLSIQEDPAVLPPITVDFRSSRFFTVRLITLTSTGSSSFGGFSEGGIAIPEIIPPCNVNDWQNINDDVARRAFTSSSIREDLRNLVSQSLAQGVEKGGRLVVVRNAAGPFSVRFKPLAGFATVTSESCDGLDFKINEPLFDNSANYTVHTHMFCNGVHSPVGSSGADRQFVRDQGFVGGIIIDTDNDLIIVYSGDESDPGQTESLCGIE